MRMEQGIVEIMRIRPPAISFDDVLLVPKRGILEKREMADISSEVVPGLKVEIPIISAPMESVTEGKMAAAMNSSGGYGIIHRNMEIGDQVAHLRRADLGATAPRRAGAAIGINKGYERWDRLVEVGCNVICIDVAHGHHDSVARFIKMAPRELRESTSLIVGNVATAEGAQFLANLDVAAVKVGIGPGAACTTREVTGFGVPQLSAISDVFSGIFDCGVKIIADGGIRNSGDIVKALAAGADTVMIGRLFAGAAESPHPGLYWGMASKRVNSHHAPEGIEGAVEHTGPIKDTLKTLAWGIRSGISYAGGTNLEDLRENAEFVQITNLGFSENLTRL